MAKEKQFVGIDIGGTRMRIAFSPSIDRPRFAKRTTASTTNDFSSDYQTISTAITTLRRGRKIDGIGISMNGNLNADKTAVEYSVNAYGFQNKPFIDRLRMDFDTKVVMDNDASAAALGEALYGDHEHQDFTYIIWGTGIGGASVSYKEGRPSVVKLDWFDNFQEWENAVGGKSLQAQYGKSGAELTDKEWAIVMQRFKESLIKFKSIANTKYIVFGGGVAIKQAERLKKTVQELEQEVEDFPKVEVSQLGEDAGLYGAIGLLQ